MLSENRRYSRLQLVANVVTYTVATELALGAPVGVRVQVTKPDPWTLEPYGPPGHWLMVPAQAMVSPRSAWAGTAPVSAATAAAAATAVRIVRMRVPPRSVVSRERFGARRPVPPGPSGFRNSTVAFRN